MGRTGSHRGERGIGSAPILALVLVLPLLLGAAAGTVRAQDPVELERTVLVLPPRVEGVEVEEAVALSLAVQSLLEHALAVHGDLDESWCQNHLRSVFPGPFRLKAWISGTKRLDDLGDLPPCRYLVTAKLTAEDRGLALTLRVLDRGTGRASAGETLVDLPGLRGARKRFISLLEEAGVHVSEARRRSMLWVERLDPMALRDLGRSLWVAIQGLYYKGIDSHGEALELLENALEGGSRSYICWTLLGWLRFSKGSYPEACSAFERALRLNSEGVDAMEGMSCVTEVLSIEGRAPDRRAARAWADLKTVVRRGRGRVLGAAMSRGMLTSEEAAHDCVNQGAVAETGGDLNEAREGYERALENLRPGILRRILSEHLATVYLRLGWSERAVALFEEALRENRAEKGDPLGEGALLNRLGLTHVALSRYDRAVESFEQALEVARKLEDRASEAEALSNLGLALASVGRYEDSLARGREALALFRAEGDSFGEMIARNLLGASSAALGRHEDAVGHCEAALSIARRLRARRIEGTVRNNLGRAYVGLGRMREALALAREALSLARETNNRVGEGFAENNLGMLQGRLGEHRVAAIHYLRAVLRYREAGNRAAEAVALSNLMRAFRQLDRPRVAIFIGKQAVNITQQLRGEVRVLGEVSAQSFLRPRIDTYRVLADLLAAEGRILEAQQVLDLLKAEEYVAFVRGDSSEASAFAGAATLTPRESETGARYREAHEKAIELGRTRGRLLMDPDPTEDEVSEITRVEEELARAEQGFQDFVLSLAGELGGPGERELDVARRIEEERGLQEDLRELGSGAVVLYTLVGEEKTWIILITPDARKGYEVSVGAEELGRKVLAFREALRRPASDPVPAARELYGVLLAPVEKDLEAAGAETLMWSLDGILRYVPVGALHDGEGFLVEKYASVIYTPASKARLKDAPRAEWRGLGLGVTRAHEGFTPLPGVVRELAGLIGETEGEGERPLIPGTVKLDEEFTRDSLRRLHRRFALVHIASHFHLCAGDERDSFLLLGDGSRLTLEAIRRSPNLFGGVDLLTLSACRTAMGAAADGREVEGFAVLAQRQGAKAVLASLWPVSDRSTPVLMRSFYRLRHEGEGTTKAQALRQAQLELLEGGADGEEERPRAPRGLDVPGGDHSKPARFSHPYHWASFVLIGNWR